MKQFVPSSTTWPSIMEIDGRDVSSCDLWGHSLILTTSSLFFFTSSSSLFVYLCVSLDSRQVWKHNNCLWVHSHRKRKRKRKSK
jgi:hypothetical protein